MSIKSAIARTIRRLNVHGVIMAVPIFGQALYEGLSEELDRVNNYREKVRNSAVPNANMDADTIEDFESRYGIDNIPGSTNTERIDRIIQRASEEGSGGPDWLQAQVRGAGFDLYVIVNTPDAVESAPQFGDYQFADVQFGSLISYHDPRDYDGELIVNSANGNIGGLYTNFGPSVQFGDEQFGSLLTGYSYPRPRPYVLPSIPDRWGYVFFLSPFDDGLATDISDFLNISDDEWRYLYKLILQTKFTRNWCLAQVDISSMIKTLDNNKIKTLIDARVKRI